MTRACLVITVIISLFSAPSRAQTPTCDELDTEQKQLAQKILSSQYAYACCDRTLAECLEQDPVCSLVYRLAENICWRVGEGQDEKKITRALSRRARSMMAGGKKAEIDLEGLPLVGDPKAPVEIVCYACARCPYCSKVVPRLHHEVTEGTLVSKAKMYFKTFPIRNHPYSKESGLAFMAAQEMGKFWDFLLHAYARFDAFCVKKQPGWAEEIGLDVATFEKLMAEPSTREKLITYKKEGIVNKVEATPTFFINGRKFHGSPTIHEMIDVIAEEYERVKGIEYRK